MVSDSDLRFPSSRWLLVVGAVFLVGVLALGAKVESLRGPLRSDAAVARQLPRPERSTLKRIADVGSEVPVLLAVLAVVAWAASRRDWRGVVVAIVAPTTALFLTEYVLKPLVDRESGHGALSYPSGHATVVAALATTAVLFVHRYHGARLALLWTPSAIALVAAVAFAVVALRWHYFSDSVGGVGLGVGVVFVVASVADAPGGRTRQTG